jgi:hypothetical protein
MLDYQAVIRGHGWETDLTDEEVAICSSDGVLVSDPSGIVDTAGERGGSRRIGHGNRGRRSGGGHRLRARLFNKGSDYSQARERGKHGGGVFGHNSPPYVELLILILIAA